MSSISDGPRGPMAPPAEAPAGVVTAPLSYGQRALWFVHSLSPESIAYQGMYLWRLRGEIDEARLGLALRALAARHASLRTTVAVEHGTPLQRISPHPDFPLDALDAGSWSEAELEERIATESQRPFDLERGPLVRARLYRRGAGAPLLLLAIHHMVLDHWSIAGMMEELRLIYAGGFEADGAPRAVLPAPRASYADFVAWQAEMVSGAAGERHWQHWSQHLAGELPVLELPTDRPRPPVQTYRGGSYTLDLDRQVIERLQAYGYRRSATPFMSLLAAFYALLYRYSGQTDILVGAPVAGRGAPQFERVVGYFTNLVPLRADLSQEPSFETLLSQVRGAVLDGIGHQDYPFSRIVERLAIHRDPSRAPLCDVIFAWEGSPPIAPAASGHGPRLELDLLELRQLGAAVDTSWSAFHKEGSIALSIQYNADLFDRETIAQMAAHYSVLLAGVVEDPTRPVSALPLLAPEERRRLLVEWNQTDAPFPGDRPIHRLFEEQVARDPAAPALIFRDEELSFSELDARANHLARELRELGVGRDVRVGLCVERSLELIVGMLGVLKAGGAFVPLDPSYPQERLAFMLEDGQMPVLLTQRVLAGGLPAHQARVMLLDERPPSRPEDRVAPDFGVTPSDVAYMIYTSGSTGQPKGVLVEHRGLCNVSQENRRVFGFGPGQRVLQFASLSFDASIWEVFQSLPWGATLVLAPREDLLPGPALLRFLRDRRINYATLPPSALAAMAPEALPDLHTIMVAGERCPLDLPQRWAGGRRFFNLYGPTEATIWSTYARLAADADRQPPIGRPIANTRIYVLDGHLEPVPVGVAGELVIGGVGVARGYLGRPDLTREKFVPDPFASGGGRMYRTGDVVRYRRDGNLDFIGRADHQVKLRGFRIELGEVEALLRSHPAVRDAVAMIRGDGGQGESLVAYVSGEGERPEPDQLRDLLRGKLPEYMVPRHLVVLDELPLNPAGKVDRRALPPPETGGAAPGSFEAPREEMERRIAAIWCAVLEVDQVGLHDNFFDLGGHSLLLAQVHERVEKELGRELSVSVLFRYPTVHDLARHLGDGEGPAARPDAASGSTRAQMRRDFARRSRRGRGDRS